MIRKIIKTAAYKKRTFFYYIIEESDEDRTEYLQEKFISWILDLPSGEYLLPELEILGIDQEKDYELSELDKDKDGNYIFEAGGVE